jgi:uncharacterized protein
MENPLHALRALQEIDRDLFRVNAELRRLPAECARRRTKLDALGEKVEERHGRIQALQVRVSDIEGTVAVQQQRIRKLEKEANSCRDMTVVEACRYEMRGLKRQIDEAEREALGYIEQIESGQTDESRLRGELEGEQAIFAEYSANVESEIGVARGKQEALQSQRDSRLSDHLDQNTLDLYDRLLQARDGEALAVLDGSICQACFMQVPPNLTVRVARGMDLVQCSSCDRILYRP